MNNLFILLRICLILMRPFFSIILLTFLILPFVNGAPTGEISQNLAFESIFAPVMGIINQIIQFILAALLVVFAILCIWAIFVLIALRSIMKRDDLSGGEKAAWVLIVLGAGFIPFSPFGMLLYALSGGKKKQDTSQVTEKKTK